MGDVGASMMAFGAISAALFGHTTTGKGQSIDISMVESIFRTEPLPPELGEHNVAVLQELLGYSNTEIGDLASAGVITSVLPRSEGTPGESAIR